MKAVPAQTRRNGVKHGQTTSIVGASLVNRSSLPPQPAPNLSHPQFFVLQVQTNLTQLANLTNLETLSSIANMTATLVNVTTSANFTVVASLANLTARVARLEADHNVTKANVSRLAAVCTQLHPCLETFKLF